MPLWTNIDNEAGKPKYLNEADKAATLGIDVAEAANIEVTHAGWVLAKTGSGGRAGRVFNETLVAMGSMTGDSDDIPPNTSTITFTEQPFDQTIQEGETANFAVDFTSSNETITATIQWQVSTDGGDTWVDIEDEEGFDLQIASTDGEYVDGNQFRAVITAGSTEAISDVATLTVTPE